MAKANSRGLQSDCAGDVIRIHDGPDVSSPLLAELCGTGHLPAIVTSKPVVLVTLYSAPHMILYDSRVELNVNVELLRVQPNETMYTTANICDQHFTDKMRTGIIATPTHTIPANSSCTYTFTSSRPDDRVWLYFASYYAPDANHWNSEEKCDSSKLEIYGAYAGERNESLIEPAIEQQTSPLQQKLSPEIDTTLKFCEKSSPLVCGRALDDPDRYLPSIPCAYHDSYLSIGPQMTVKQYHFKSNNLYAAGSSFLARFEFVDTNESGAPIADTLCDRLFESSVASSGSVRSTRNVFMFGRGGRRDVSCAYRFVGKKGETLRFHLNRFRLNSTACHHTMDAASGQYVCRATASTTSLSSAGDGNGAARSARLATLTVQDTIKQEAINVGCFCSGEFEPKSREKAISFDLIGNEVIVNLTMTGMLSTDDFNDFSFDATYEFVPSENECHQNGFLQQRDGRGGEMFYSVPSDYRFDREVLKCRWLLETSAPGKHLYLSFKGSLPK